MLDDMRVHSSLVRFFALGCGGMYKTGLTTPAALTESNPHTTHTQTANPNQQLVAEAETVAAELINVALTRHERWHEGLEEASRLYFAASASEGGQGGGAGGGGCLGTYGCADGFVVAWCLCVRASA